MKSLLVSTAVIGLSAFALHCGDDASSTCNGVAECSSPMPDGDAGGTDGSSGGTDSGVPIPPGCDPNADVKDAPKCVVNEFGVFVDAAKGNDGNSGSKELPMKTIGGALGKLNGKSRVYVCEGTYAESVKVTSAVSLYGGFACADWSYSGALAKIAPGAAGKEALVVENVKAAVVVSDVHAEAAAGDATNKNSIAARIVGSTDVKLVRVKATAGAGFDGAKGADGTTGTLVSVSSGAMSLNGDPASGSTAGAAKTCTCSSGGTTTGGAGGAPAADGAGGAPKLAGAPPKDGAGGTGNVADCNPSGFGHSGADAASMADAIAATQLGEFQSGQWLATSGAEGMSGAPGQGGGGGGGLDTENAGSGGGCGGCGGVGGKGGAGGGASVSVAIVESSVALTGCSFAAQDAGKGGDGGTKGIGATGGNPGNQGLCLGGKGGKGGDGGAGAGGAGGISAGVLYKGTKPTVDAATEAAITVGKAGGKGIGGAPDVNDGPEGIAEKIHGL